jgi:hypothetical protein
MRQKLYNLKIKEKKINGKNSAHMKIEAKFLVSPVGIGNEWDCDFLQ